MNAKVLLCADEEGARHPELIGLREENLLEQPWLAVRTTAREARDLAAKSASIEEYGWSLAPTSSRLTWLRR